LRREGQDQDFYDRKNEESDDTNDGVRFVRKPAARAGNLSFCSIRWQLGLVVGARIFPRQAVTARQRCGFVYKSLGTNIASLCRKQRDLPPP